MIGVVRELEKVMGGMVGWTLGVGGLLLVMGNLRAERAGAKWWVG